MTWVRPAVTDVNGEQGPSITLEAGDIPSSGPSDVQADLDALKYIETAADLEARFPAAGGQHTIDEGSEWRLPAGTTEIDIGSNTIVGVHPGGVTFVGAQGIIKTDVDATLASGELAVGNVIFNNVNVGSAALCVDIESLAGRSITLEDWGVRGLHPGRLANVFGFARYANTEIVGVGAGATSLEIDGTNGPALFTVATIIAPGSTAFAGIRVLSTASAAGMGIQSSAVQGAVPGDALLFIDPAVTVPPDGTISVTQSTRFGPAEVFDSTGLGPSDSIVLSLNNINAPSSKWLGDLTYESNGGAPITLTMSGSPEVMPVENAGPTASAALTIGSERFVFPTPTGLQDYELISTSRNDAIQGEVSITCTVKRNGGTIRQFRCWVQYRTGPDPAVWTTIDESKGERSLNNTYDSVRGSAPFQWDRTYEFRPVVEGLVGTDTDILDWRLQIGQGRP